MKKHLTGNKYHSENDDVISVIHDVLDKQDENFFTNGIQTLQHRLRKKKVGNRKGFMLKTKLLLITLHENILVNLNFQPTLANLD